MKFSAMVERKTSVACGVLGLKGTGSSELLCPVGLTQHQVLVLHTVGPLQVTWACLSY